ncbi:MAG TPA: hypothetical protein VF721_14630 [Pyrinomonadaceae bacterium]|jgi:hypothetical protein
MFNSIKSAALAAFLFIALVATASAQQTSGSVTMNATVSNFVELNSGGAVTLSGNSGGGITTDGTVNNPLAVVVNLGELGPGNTNSFVKLTVPLKMRSNAAYQLSMSGGVSGAGSTVYRLKASDVGFGLVTSARATTLASGTDTNATPGDPTTGGSTDADGRWVFDGSNSTLDSFSASTEVLSGPRINKTVPRSNTTGLTVPAIFAVKPQFFDPASSATINVSFTIAAP